jgi:PAS domain S-box-containing protein
MSKTEENFIENDKKLKAILNTIPDLLFHYDQNGNYISIYQNQNENLIAKPEAFIGRNIKDFFDKELSDAFLYAIKQTLANGHYVHEYEFFDKKTKYYSAKYSKINNDEVICLVNEITILKESEFKIRYLYHQQKLLADISQLLSISVNPEPILNEVLRLVGEHTDVSRVYIFEDFNNGQTTSNTYEWCNEGIDPQIDELQDFPYEIIPSWKKFLNNEGRIFSRDIKELPQDIYEVLSPQGIKSILIYPLIVEKSFFGFIGFDECVKNKYWAEDEIDLLRTISNLISNAFERKQVMCKLRESELRLKLAMEGSQQGLWDWNNLTDEVYFNDMWCIMLGYDPGEVARHVSSWSNLVHPEDMPEVMDALKKHLRGETEFYESTHRLRTKNGAWKWIFDKGFVVQRNEKNEPVRTIGSHFDISRQKETEQQLKDSIAIRNKIFSIIAHDLRGPIGSFLPALEVLTTNQNLDEEIKKEYLTGLKKASITTFNLLENLLNWSQFHSNVFIIEPAYFTINTLIKENIELFVSTANQKSVKISLKSDGIFTVFADKESVNLVIRNLISNAIKFTPNGGDVIISLSESTDKINIMVSDTGVGMEKATVSTLLNSKTFFSSEGTNNEKGSGLGLLLCKEFIEKNDSELFADSIPGKGSRFWFALKK